CLPPNPAASRVLGSSPVTVAQRAPRPSDFPGRIRTTPEVRDEHRSTAAVSPPWPPDQLTLPAPSPPRPIDTDSQSPATTSRINQAATTDPTNKHARCHACVRAEAGRATDQTAR